MSGKVVVITGANGGLGQALARSLVADGEKVVLLGRSLAKVKEVADEIGGEALPVECDVSSPDSVRAAFAAIASAHRRIDVLINNAATFAPYLIEEASDEQILGSVLTNLAGPMLTARSAIPLLDGGGLIINISSESIDSRLPHMIGYQSTKAGVENLGRHLHAELKDRGIRVTTVRAGAMVGPGQTPQVAGDAGLRFFQEAIKRGANPMDGGLTQYSSTLQTFRTIINAPADLHFGLVTLEARKPL